MWTSSRSCSSGRGRTRPANVTFVEGDATNLPFDSGSFDLTCTRRTLHHIAHPERAVAELARVTASGGSIFVDDQIAPADPLEALSLDRFERARDPSHTRTLPDIDLRQLFEANGLVLVRTRFQSHRRELDYYLGLAGCQGDDAERVKQLSPGGPDAYVAESAWYLLQEALAIPGAGGESCHHARHDRLCDRGDAVPARHEGLPLVALDHLYDVPRDTLGLDDEPAQQRAPQEGRLREPFCLDEARVDRVHVDAARTQLRCRGP